MNLNELIDSYYEARREHDEASAEATRLHNKLKAREMALIDGMVNEHMPSIRRDDGTTVSLRKNLSFSCTQENREDIRGWLTATEGDDTPFVEEVVSKTAVTELLKKKIEEEGVPEDEFPDFLKLSTRPGLTVRGWKNLE